MKATAIAPSNIAFIKYWGKSDEKLRIPANGSISMNLSHLTTTTTVEFSNTLKTDDVSIDGEREQDEMKRVSQHLDRIRKIARLKTSAKVVSVNNFPTKTGLSSSASGFAALTVAAAAAAGLHLSEKELSMLARLGSGSACRSIPDGFVEWVKGNSHESSFARSIFPSDYWDIVDIVAVVSRQKKEVSSSRGQMQATTSPFFQTRLKNIDKKIACLKQLIAEKNFREFGRLVEEEALELHTIMMTSTPSLIYLRPETVTLIKAVEKWRKSGLPVYFTLNTGQDVHLICEEKNYYEVIKLLKTITEVKQTIINKPGRGAQLVDKHLF